MISQSTIQQILGRLDIIDVVGSFVKLKKRGASYLGLCPFHNEKTASFTVDPDKGFWRCFGQCGIGGDIFAFVMKAESLTFPEAAERLAQIAGVTLTYKNGLDASEAARQRELGRSASRGTGMAHDALAYEAVSISWHGRRVAGCRRHVGPSAASIDRTLRSG